VQIGAFELSVSWHQAEKERGRPYRLAKAYIVGVRCELLVQRFRREFLQYMSAFGRLRLGLGDALQPDGLGRFFTNRRPRAWAVGAQLAGRKKCLSQRSRRMNGHAMNRAPVQCAEVRTIARDHRVAALMDGGR